MGLLVVESKMLYCCDKAFGNFMKNRPAVGATVAAMGMFLGMQSATTANTIMFATYFNKASMSGVVQTISLITNVPDKFPDCFNIHIILKDRIRQKLNRCQWSL